MNNQMTITTTGSALMGAGLVMVQTDVVTALTLIGVGTVLTILVAYLQKKGLDVQTSNLG